MKYMKRTCLMVLVSYLLINCSSFVMVDPYEVFLDPKDYLKLECGEGSYGNNCRRAWREFGFEIDVLALYGWNCSIDRDSSLLTIDLKVYPKKVQKKIIFYPNLITVTEGQDTLRAVKSKKQCTGRPSRCCYRMSFRITPASMSESKSSNDTILFTIDLSKALSYDGIPLDMGMVRGKLASGPSDR